MKRIDAEKNKPLPMSAMSQKMLKPAYFLTDAYDIHWNLYNLNDNIKGSSPDEKEIVKAQ